MKPDDPGPLTPELLALAALLKRDQDRRLALLADEARRDKNSRARFLVWLAASESGGVPRDDAQAVEIVKAYRRQLRPLVSALEKVLGALELNRIFALSHDATRQKVRIPKPELFLQIIDTALALRGELRNYLELIWTATFTALPVHYSSGLAKRGRRTDALSQANELLTGAKALAKRKKERDRRAQLKMECTPPGRRARK